MVVTALSPRGNAGSKLPRYPLRRSPDVGIARIGDGGNTERTLRWLRMSKSTSAIRKVPGNVARTKTPICFHGNPSREEPTCLAILKRISTESHCA